MITASIVIFNDMGKPLYPKPIQVEAGGFDSIQQFVRDIIIDEWQKDYGKDWAKLTVTYRF